MYNIIKLVLIFIITMLNLALNAQQTYVVDSNFENYLETHNSIGHLVSLGDMASMGNGIANDNYVLTSNIDSVVFLNISNLNISDLTGIENFLSLVSLNCNNNQLNNIDISNITNLQSLNCSNNLLTNLGMSHQNSLTMLDCSYNQLNSLDLSQNGVLLELYCRNNQLTSLDVANQNNSNVDEFIAVNNPNLTCIKVDNTAWSTSNWTDIDNTAFFSEICQTSTAVYVPDDNFENYLETHNANGGIVYVGDATSMGNGIANDNYVIRANINTVSSLTVYNKNIYNLTGIEGFANLTYLNCALNNLSSLDLTGNTKLKTLRCYINNIETLNISNNSFLTHLHCKQNNLETLDISNNPNLILVNCVINNLNSLNTNNNTELVSLTCINNNLSTLDVSNNTNLELLWCDDNNIINLDLSNNPALMKLSCGYNNGLELDLSNNPNLTHLSCERNYTNVDVTNNPALTTLSVRSNNLASLDVTNNPNLISLSCPYNYLKRIDLSNNPNLLHYSCSRNAFTTIDVSNNTSLRSFLCSDNPNLKYINLKNGNNHNISINTDNLPLLEYVCVDELGSNLTDEILTLTGHSVSFSTECTQDIGADRNRFFSIYPNPITDVLNIQSREGAFYSIFNMNDGKQVKSGDLFAGNNTINCINFSKGMYFIKITSNTNTFIKKLLIK